MDNRKKAPKKKIFKISIVDRYNKCQKYGHVVVNCTSPFKIAIINGVPIIATKSESAILLKITSVIKKFSVGSPATTVVIPTATAIAIARPSFPGSTFDSPTPQPLAISHPSTLLSWPALVATPFLLYC